MPQKRILHVFSTSYFLFYFIGEQIEHFNNIGTEWFVACDDDGFLDSFAKKNHIKALDVKITRSITPLKDLIAIYKVFLFIKRNRINIVIGHTPKGSMVGIVAAMFGKVKKRIYYRHGVYYETSRGFKRKILKSVEWITCKCATEIISVSKSVLEVSRSNNFDFIKKDIFVGSNGSINGINSIEFFRENFSKVDIDSFKFKYGIKEDYNTVGFVGRIVVDKGVEDLVNAWQVVVMNQPKSVLIIVGQFEDKDAINAELLQYIENEPTIIYVNHLEDVRPIYAILDIFILPSYREGLPTVLLEASAMELPIITTNATGCIDVIIEDETGIICTHDPYNIAEKIQYYLENPEIRKEHGKNGRKFVVQNFNQSEIWDDFENKILKSN